MFEAIFSSAVIVALIANFVATLNLGSKLESKNITEERKVWRDNIRKQALWVHDAIETKNVKNLKRLKSEFTALLNPTHDDDLELIDCIECCIKAITRCNDNSFDPTEYQDAFSFRISLLLKHDWERVKHEVSLFSRFRYSEPNRISYKDWHEAPLIEMERTKLPIVTCNRLLSLIIVIVLLFSICPIAEEKTIHELKIFITKQVS